MSSELMTNWVVLYGPEFFSWWSNQSPEIQDRMFQSIRLLQQFGPFLQRPYADTVKGSLFPNMKELRVQVAGKPIRAFYAFDMQRQAIVLCAGDKTGNKRFYSEMITLADREFANYLEKLGEKSEQLR